jgi:hypothetical protein
VRVDVSFGYALVLDYYALEVPLHQMMCERNR